MASLIPKEPTTSLFPFLERGNQMQAQSAAEALFFSTVRLEATTPQGTVTELLSSSTSRKTKSLPCFW